MKGPVRLNASILRDAIPPVPEESVNRIMRQIDRMPEKERQPMKKKLSVGLVLALVLCLLAVSALAAALLSVQEVMEQELIPIVQESERDYFTTEEAERVLAIAEENGLHLDDELRRKMFDRQGHADKYALLFTIFSVEYGRNAGLWTPEEWATAEEILYNAGLTDIRVHFMPVEGALTMEQATEIANTHVRETYDAEADLTDESQYRLSVMYYHRESEESKQRFPEWFIQCEALTADRNAYYIGLTAEGKILYCEVTPAPCVEPGSFYTRYEKEHGPMNTWDHETWQAFARDAQNIRADYEYGRLLQAMSFPDISPDALPREQAIDLALAQADVPGAQASAVYTGTEEHPLWKVRLEHEEGIDAVEIDAFTGEITSVHRVQEEDSDLLCYMPLEEYKKYRIKY